MIYHSARDPGQSDYNLSFQIHLCCHILGALFLNITKHQFLKTVTPTVSWVTCYFSKVVAKYIA